MFSKASRIVDRQDPFGLVQKVSPGGELDLGPGYLDPDLLPTSLVRNAFTTALEKYGWRALSYGADAGPWPLRELLAEMCMEWDGTPYGTDNVLVTAGTSHILDHLAARMAAPGDTVVVESPSYDLGCMILREHGLRLVGVPVDQDGVLPDALDWTVAQLRRSGARLAFAYLIPTFHNPTGALVSAERRRTVVAVARSHRLRIIEDNAYRPLPLAETDVPASLLSLADSGAVIQLGTFSKCLAPGLRLGWLIADPSSVQALASGAVFRSGGCPNHLVASATTELLAAGMFRGHLTRLRAGLTDRRDALVAGLRAGLPSGYQFMVPGGGLFLWIRPPAGIAEGQLCAATQRHGVVMAPGARFSTRPSEPAVRLAFSQYGPDDLGSAAAAICRGVAELHH